MKCPSCQTENLPESRFCHRCATPLTEDLLSLAPGQTPATVPVTQTMVAPVEELVRGSVFADRYEVIEDLGQGGMGRVYKVFDRKLHETVALKLIRLEIGLNVKAIERFKNELKLARRIAHRNVCRMYDLGEVGLSHFLTMEFVPGENLKSFIRRSDTLAPAKAVSIAKQAAEGLAEAHRLGVVHRDLKPQNIMIDREGNAKIMDFGIARFIDAQGTTSSGLLVGTPEYMSPEQAEIKDVDRRTDLYSMGVILYEMVTGNVPFEGETPLSVAMKHKHERPTAVREINPHVSESLAAVIMKCLEKDRSRRYQTAEELAADLSRVEEGFPIAERSLLRRDTHLSRELTARIRLKKFLVPTLFVLTGAVISILMLVLLAQKKVPPELGPVTHREAPPSAPTEPGRPARPDIWQRLGGEVIKYMPLKDVEGISDAKKLLETVKGTLPADSPLHDIYNKAMQKFEDEKRLQEEGNPGEARKSGLEGQAEMQKLMKFMADREAAQSAQVAMLKAKVLAQPKDAARPKWLFQLAQAQEAAADEAFRANDYAGAKTLYRVLENIYGLSSGCQVPESCVASLRIFVEKSKRSALTLPAARVDPWLRAYAQEIESQALQFQRKGELDNAAASYIQAAFLYEKLKEQAQP